MGVALSATVYIWFAQGLAFLLMPWSIPLATRLRGVAFWAIAAPILFALNDPLLALILVAAILFFVAPFAPLERCAFFLVAVPAVPAFVTAPLPFPGINYLFDATHYKFAVLVLLLPALFLFGRRKRPVRAFGAADASLLIFVLYVAALIGMNDKLTVGVRALIDYALVLLVPYFVLHFVTRDIEDIDAIFKAFIVASVLLAAVAVVSLVKRWDIYGILNPNPFTEFRDGRPRIDATANTHSLAFHLAAGVVVLEYLKHRVSIGWLWLNGLRALFIAGMLAAGSRGAFAGLAIAWCLYMLLMARSTVLKVSTILAAVIGLIAVGLWLAQDDMSAVDEHGTFAYRQELLRTSVNYIMQHPLIGDLRFLESGAFDHLVTGLGIIDLTNLYLLIAVQFGLIGLALFFFPFFHPLVSLLPRLLREAPVSRAAPASGLDRQGQRRRAAAVAAPADDGPGQALLLWHRAAAVSVAVLVGWLFLVITTSDVGLTVHLGIVFAALACALRSLRPIQAAATRPLGSDRFGRAGTAIAT